MFARSNIYWDTNQLSYLRKASDEPSNGTTKRIWERHNNKYQQWSTVHQTKVELENTGIGQGRTQEQDSASSGSTNSDDLTTTSLKTLGDDNNTTKEIGVEPASIFA
jgi:hypothetical protein